MKKYCPGCDKNTAVLTQLSIPIGNQTFQTQAYACPKCKNVEMTPEVRKNMDEWGKSLKKDIISPQPFFSAAAHQFLEEMASQFGMNKFPFIKALTAYYLNVAVATPEISLLKEIAKKHPATALLAEGTKSKITIPINYMLYVKIKTYCDVWETTPAKVIEESVLFCLTVLSVNDNHFAKLKAIADSLRQYMVVFSQAA